MRLLDKIKTVLKNVFRIQSDSLQAISYVYKIFYYTIIWNSLTFYKKKILLKCIEVEDEFF